MPISLLDAPRNPFYLYRLVNPLMESGKYVTKKFAALVGMEPLTLFNGIFVGLNLGVKPA